jgi:hypothetical protein
MKKWPMMMHFPSDRSCPDVPSDQYDFQLHGGRQGRRVHFDRHAASVRRSCTNIALMTNFIGKIQTIYLEP